MSLVPLKITSYMSKQLDPPSWKQLSPSGTFEKNIYL